MSTFAGTEDDGNPRITMGFWRKFHSFFSDGGTIATMAGEAVRPQLAKLNDF